MSGKDAPALEVRGIAKAFFGVPVLRDVTFAVAAGTVLGLIGGNGSGKSTTMNILGGVLPRDAGEMRIDGHPYEPKSPRDARQAGIAFIHQELNLFGNLSIRENLFIEDMPRLGPLPVIDRRGMDRRAHAVLAEIGLDVSPAMPVSALSPGERQLVEIAKALIGNARMIIFDEPTTSLTSREADRLFEIVRQLRARGVAIIYISHALADVSRISDDLLVLRDGAPVGSGKVSDMPVERVVTLMLGRPMDRFFPERPPRRTGEVVLDVRGLTQPGVVCDVTFALHRGEVLGLSGLMGSGRTETARMIFGLDSYDRGAIAIKGRPLPPNNPRRAIAEGVAFLTENRREEGILLDSSIGANMALPSLKDFAGRFGLLDTQHIEREARRLAGVVHLKAHDPVRTEAKSLSGGNQQKVVFAKWLARQPDVFILDEPTRGIDVGAKYEIYRIINELAAEGAGVLMISSEIEELMGMCDRIAVMAHGEIRSTVDAGNGGFDRAGLLRLALSEQARAG